METPDAIQLWISVAVLLYILLYVRDRLGPAIRDIFRGGPRPPSHPLPADDSAILTRPRRPAVPE
jgi:hypothetical protein